MLSLALGVLVLALPAGARAAETGNIAGTVTAEGGAPFPRVEVCAESVDKSHYECDLTRNDGTYEITGLPEGEYRVGFWTTGNYIVQFWHEALTWNSASPVTVTGGATAAGIDVELKQGALIEGTVTAMATGEPVGEVEACANVGELERCAKTNAAGEYAIDGLVEGIWSVYFYAMKAKADVVSQPYAAGDVAVGPRQILTGVNQALIPGGQIAGTVRLAGTGAPVGGVLVCVTTATSSVPLSCLRTPSTGAYRFTRVWPGSFKVVFSPEPTGLEGPDSFPTQWWNGQSSFEAATPIAITPPQIVNGIDASLVAPGPPPAPVASSPPPVVKKPVLKCKRGFVKRRVRGKRRCVRRHKARSKLRRNRHHQAKDRVPYPHPRSQRP